MKTRIAAQPEREPVRRVDAAGMPSVYLGNLHGERTMSEPAHSSAEEFVYDPNHPMNVEDRANDPDDGIDYDEIIMTTEADFRAGRGRRFSSLEEFREWFDKF